MIWGCQLRFLLLNFSTKINLNKYQVNINLSFLHHHISPVHVHDDYLLEGHCSELIGVVGPKYPHHLFSHLESPLHFFTHRVEYHNIVPIQQHQSASFPIEFRMFFLLHRKLWHVDTQDLVPSEIFLKLNYSKTYIIVAETIFSLGAPPSDGPIVRISCKNSIINHNHVVNVLNMADKNVLFLNTIVWMHLIDTHSVVETCDYKFFSNDITNVYGNFISSYFFFVPE